MDKFLDILRSFIPNFENLSNIPLPSGMGPGWLFGAFSAVAISLYGLSLGRTRAVLSLLSIYAALVIVKLFPYFSNVSQMAEGSVADYWIKVGIFIGTYVIVFLIFNFSFIRKRLSSTEFSLFGIILISILQLGFLASIILSLLPDELAMKWSFGFYNYFATKQALFIWAVLPLPVLLFIKRK